MRTRTSPALRQYLAAIRALLVLTVIFGLAYPLHYVYRRRRLKPGPLPLYAVTIFLATMVVDAVLWLNAFTPILHFSAGPYAIGVTWLLAQAGIILLNTFSEFMRTER